MYNSLKPATCWHCQLTLGAALQTRRRPNLLQAALLAPRALVQAVQRLVTGPHSFTQAETLQGVQILPVSTARLQGDKLVPIVITHLKLAVLVPISVS